MVNAMTLGELVLTNRKRLGLSQAELASQVGRTRHWVIQLEKGSWYEGKEFKLDPDMAVKLAAILDVDPVEVLEAAKVPATEWPDLSHTRSNSAKVQTVDITALSPQQAKLIRTLVDELKAGNTIEHNDKDAGKQL
ncbi:helix-turn-helix transcriptional regulator [Corynebacterium incognita]|uniref:Helix-turn-helix transcriptional regulator n=1 Tax=Corynebacterium incognita TaxID=2754725 RepID=A0A7G7CRT0_9CORY|nr:helix-turn-helix transcriptional regulator [Corynebacterium incognita]QNE90296.1 helix-turn-helix transcriptional regulator [Corynebacterium incognita]